MQYIVEKFNFEVSNINEYIEFLENYVMNILNPKVSNIEDSVKNLDELKSKNNNNIEKVTKEINKIELKELPNWAKSIDARSQEGELIEYIMQELEVTDDTEKIIESIKEELESICIIKGDQEDGDFYLNLYNSREEICKYVELSKNIYNNILYYDKENELKILINNEKALKLIDTKNKINIYRQAFNQLVFLFDSTVFDIIKNKFNENFFAWINYFNKDESIKLKDIGSNEDYNNFKLMIIEKLLKKCYLRDLIEILHREYKNIFYIGKVDTYIDFIEMINRRNCHIHNNGIVDNSYLGIDRNNTQPRYNKYNFQLGEYIEIDKKYFEKSLKNCIGLLDNIKGID